MVLRLVGQTQVVTSDNIIRLGKPQAPENIIRLGKQPKKKLPFREKLERGLIAETALLAGLTVGAGTFLVNPILALPAGLGAFTGTASLLGAIREKPTFFKGLATGRGGAAIVNLPQTIQDIKIPKLDTGLTAKEIAALIAAAGIGAGIGAGVTTIIDRTKTVVQNIPKSGEVKAVIPPTPQFFQTLPTGTQIQQQPIGVVEKAPVEEKEKVEKAEIPQIINKNVFKPKVNISFKKSRRFINQQINV